VMWALQGRFENGVIKLGPGLWNEQFLDELYQFPDHLTHDDMVDSLAYIDQMVSVPYFGEHEMESYEYVDIVAGY